MSPHQLVVCSSMLPSCIAAGRCGPLRICLRAAQSTCAAVQREFGEVTARLRLLSTGPQAAESSYEHMETSILILGPSSVQSVGGLQTRLHARPGDGWRVVRRAPRAQAPGWWLAGETAVECGQLEQQALLLLIGHAARCPHQRALVQKLLVSIAGRLAYSSLAQYLALHAATLSYDWFRSSFTVPDMLAVQVRSAAVTKTVLPVATCNLLATTAEALKWRQEAWRNACRACCPCQRQIRDARSANFLQRGCPTLCRLWYFCSCRNSSATLHTAQVCANTA